MNILIKFRILLEKLEKGLLVFLLSIIVLFSFVQVILRQFFSGGLLWGDIFLRHLVLWIGFLGAAIATQENKHFAIDIVKGRLPQKLKFLSEIVTQFFALACLFLLSGSALKFIKDDYSSGSVLFTAWSLEVPAFWLDIIIPIGFILLLIHFALKMVEDMAALLSSRKEEGAGK